jgi:hypothetical protein
MATPAKKKETVAVALAGGPAQAVAVIPNSSMYRGFSIVVTGFDIAEPFTIQGSYDGTTFFNLDSDSFSLPTPHILTSATPTLMGVTLHTPLPGGIRLVSDNATLTVDGTILVMMFKSAYSRGLSEYS